MLCLWKMFLAISSRMLPGTAVLASAVLVEIYRFALHEWSGGVDSTITGFWCNDRYIHVNDE